MSVAPLPRVLFVANDPPGAAVYRYRCENLADVLRAGGWQADVAWIGDRQIRVDHDVVVLHRICAVAEGRALARAARACGATLIYGADDLVFEEEAFPLRTDIRKRLFAPLHAAMAREARALLVSTEYLAKRSRDIFDTGFDPARDAHVFRNFLAPELIALSEAARLSRTTNRQEVTLGYLSGTPTHDADLAAVAEPLAAILRVHPNTRLLLVGPVKPPPLVAEAAGSRLERMPLVGWRDLPAVLARLDINLAPLVAKIFAASVSTLKPTM